jgi:hypothetical protein
VPGMLGAHLQGVRCTKATWPLEKRATGSVCTVSERFHTRMARGESARAARVGQGAHVSGMATVGPPNVKESGRGGARAALMTPPAAPSRSCTEAPAGGRIGGCGSPPGNTLRRTRPGALDAPCLKQQVQRHLVVDAALLRIAVPLAGGVGQHVRPRS